LKQIKASQQLRKVQKKERNARDSILGTAKYNYELPPFIFWNEIELKI